MEERRGHSHGEHRPPRRARGERSKHAGGASFSASLLDAIYHSFDESADAAGVVADAARRSDEKGTEPPQFWWAKEADRKKQEASADCRSRRRDSTAVARQRHSGYDSSTASSSDASTSSCSFSCSSVSTTDTESTRRRRSPTLPPPCRQREEVVAPLDTAERATPPNRKSKKKSRPCFPGARLRPRDATAPSSPWPLPPTSPATFACALKALFTSARLQRKPKAPTAVPSPQALQASSPQPSSTTPTTSTAETAERRSVRFCSVSEASLVRRRVEELVQSLGELEEDEEGSDSSSDLFELESISGANGDELPVYGTTSLVTNRAIAHGAVLRKQTETGK